MSEREFIEALGRLRDQAPTDRAQNEVSRTIRSLSQPHPGTARRRLSPDEVRAMRARWRDGESVYSIARAYGVAYAAAHSAIHAQTHRNVRDVETESEAA